MAALGSNMKGKVKSTGLVKEIKQTRSKTTSAKNTPKAKAGSKKATPIAAKSTSSVKATKKGIEKKVAKPTAAKTKKATLKASKAVAVPKKPVTKATKSKTTSKKETKKTGKREPLALKNAQLIIEPSKRRTIRKTKVYMEGELTINNVDAFAELIHPVFSDYDYIDFNLRSITSLDLCFIQMLYHFQKSYGSKKKTVKIDSDMSTELKKIVINAGFEELMFIPKLV